MSYKLHFASENTDEKSKEKSIQNKLACKSEAPKNEEEDKKLNSTK